MDEDQYDDLFDDEDERFDDDFMPQSGPDLFGTEPDELILPSEPTPVPDPEMDLPLDEPDEIPIDPDEESEDDESLDAGEPSVRTAAPSAVHDGSQVTLDAPPAPAQPVEIDRPEPPLALYRRYRPETFAEVIGQEHVTEPLQRALINNRVNHAYLFSGPRGCGKTTSARILARCLNCEKGPTPTPCGECRSCRDLARGGAGSIDVIEIDAASHGGVDEARDLRERAFFAPVQSRYKIYIIDEAHMVTTQGFNALLKVVEEPPAHVKFIFATTEPEKVIGTIRSRTHHYPFRLVPPKTLISYLGQLCESEGVAIDPAVLPLVVRAGAGSVRDSLSVLDQLLGSAGTSGVEYRQAAALLGYTPDSLLDEMVDAFAAGDSAGVFACIDKVIEVGQDPRRFAEDLLRRFRDLVIVAAVPDALTSGLVDVSADQAERLTTQAAGLGPGELTRAAEVIANGLTEMRGTTAPRLHLEMMCARVLLPGADVDGRGIHARLDRIERRLSLPHEVTEAAPPPVAPEFQRAARRASEAAGSERPTEAGPHGAEPRPETPTSNTSDERRPRNDHAQRQPERTVEPLRPTPPEPTPVPTPEHRDEGPQPVSGGPARRPDEAPRRQQPAPQASEYRQHPDDAPRQQPTPNQPPAPPAAPAAQPGAVTTADVRRMWPQVLDAVKNRRRVTWIILRENSQVQNLADGVLTLGVNNAGARESFGRGGSEDILRESLLDVMGLSVRIETVVIDGAVHHDEPAPEPPAAAAPPRREQAAAASEYVEEAKRNIHATRPTAEPEPEPEPDRNDIDLDDGTVDPNELITQHLGAELIGEEEPPGR